MKCTVRSIRQSGHVAALVAVGTAVALFGSSCASTTGSETSTEDVATAYAYAGTAADTADAVAKGEAASPGPAELPTGKKVGLIQLSAQSASSVRIEAALRAASGLLGWDVVTCDPDFDTQKLQQCGTSILSQNPDVIISASQNPTQMSSAIATARERGIPWFGTLSGGTQTEGFTDYGIDGTSLASLTDAWMLDEMDKSGSTRSKQVLAFTAPTVGVANLNQQDQLVRDIDAHSGAELVVTHDIDLSNAAQDVIATTTQTLQQRPDLGAVWTVCDFCLPLISQSVQQAQGDDRSTMIVGTFSTPASIDGLRNGTIDAIGEYAWESQVWVAIDQALQNMARGTDIAPDFSVFDSYGLDFMSPYILDSEAVGTEGPAPILGGDFASYFTAKWKAEFGLE